MTKPSRPYRIDLQFRGHIEGLTFVDQASQPLCHFFGGVPFALPPVGPFRFAKPRSLPTCYRYGTKVNPGRFVGGCGRCPQPSAGKVLDDSLWDEDCLQNNIWVPTESAPTEGWPVLFYIHGGFLQVGSPNSLDLRAFMNESPCKCIVVAPAYRLNIFGFLASPESIYSGSNNAANLGFWDQRMALQWTYENISYFGGNASNITIGGYSAGSYSVFHQLAYDFRVPESKAIIKRALMLSNGPGMQPKGLEEAQDQCHELFKALNIPSHLSESEKLSRLRALDAKTLLRASQSIHLHQFRAVTDNDFVHPDLLDDINSGAFAQHMKRRNVALIIGECSEEHHSYGVWYPPQPDFDNVLHRLEVDYPRAASKALMQHYFPNRQLTPKYKTWQEAFGHIYADVQIHHFERGFLNALTQHGADHLIHRYRIEWRAKCVDKSIPKEWGATHTSDIPIWFWGNGDEITETEKEIVLKAFHVPLSKFLRGADPDWGTNHGLQTRTLKTTGKVVIEDDTRLEEGLGLWEALKSVGATGQATMKAKL